MGWVTVKVKVDATIQASQYQVKRRGLFTTLSSRFSATRVVMP
jgi:hypothetical protein